MIGRILLGILLCGVGGLFCYYSYDIVKFFGRNAWAEIHLGGTRNLVLLLGFVIMILGVLTMFGVFVGSPTEQIDQIQGFGG
ncbi:MAG: hypothetical protein HXJ92_00720 [candidate division SR1 bacterium]|nr:hypothetical protein [candidate division SR1 bacterium]